MAFTLAIRTITAPDPDASQVPGIDTTGAVGLTLGLLCDTPNAMLTLRIIWATRDGKFLASGMPITFTSGAKQDWSTSFVAVPSIVPACDILGELALVKVDSMPIATAKWTIVPGLLR